jgi:hypothetical protein
MAYVGTPIDTTNTFTSLQGKRFSGDNSETNFTLDVAPSSTLDIEVFVGNVRQDPNSAYTVSGTTLTFSAAPPTGTNNIYVVHQAKAVSTIDVPTGGVVAGSLGSSVLTGQTDIGGAIADADLFLVDDGAGGTLRKTAASRIKTYAGFGVSDITGATELAAEPADTDEFVLSDAGTLKRIDYSHIRAGWQLLSTTDVSDGTSTVNMTLAGSYALYAVTLTNLIPNNDNNTLRHAFSDDDFSSVNQQIYGGFAIHGVTKSAFYTNDNFQSATGYVRIADTVGGNNTYEGVRGIIYYANMRTAAPKGMYWGNVMGYDAAEKAANHTLAGWMDSTNVCTGIAYNYDSGTFKSGQIKLYGLK